MNEIKIYPHWEYLLALESDLERAARFVNFSRDHFNVYSVEFTHILLAASSEAEVIMKSLCKKLDPSKTHGNISDYKKTLKTKLPIMLSSEVRVPRYGLAFFPFMSWEKDEERLAKSVLAELQDLSA